MNLSVSRIFSRKLWLPVGIGVLGLAGLTAFAEPQVGAGHGSNACACYQGSGGPRGPGGPGSMHADRFRGHDHGGPMGFGMRRSPMGMLHKRLALSDDQRTKIKAVMDEHREAAEQQRMAMRDAARTLRTDVHADKPDDAKIKADAAKLGQVIADGAVLRSQVISEIKPILTADQIKTLKELRSRRDRGIDEFLLDQF